MSSVDIAGFRTDTLDIEAGTLYQNTHTHTHRIQCAKDEWKTKMTAGVGLQESKSKHTRG